MTSVKWIIQPVTTLHWSNSVESSTVKVKVTYYTLNVVTAIP